MVNSNTTSSAHEEFAKLIGRKQLELMRAGDNKAAITSIEATYAPLQEKLLKKIEEEDSHA